MVIMNIMLAVLCFATAIGVLPVIAIAVYSIVKFHDWMSIPGLIACVFGVPAMIIAGLYVLHTL